MAAHNNDRQIATTTARMPGYSTTLPVDASCEIDLATVDAASRNVS